MEIVVTFGVLLLLFRAIDGGGGGGGGGRADETSPFWKAPAKKLLTGSKIGTNLNSSDGNKAAELRREAMLTIYTNNTISLDDSAIVARLDASGDLHGRRKNSFIRIFTGSIGNMSTPHEIRGVAAYIPARVGSVSDWKINPDFERAVREIVKNA